MQSSEMISFASAGELASRAAGLWLGEIESAKRAGKTHCVALSGGRITQKLFAAIVEQAKARKSSFEGVHFFWADERCVPPHDPDSNFKMAEELLFAPLKIPRKQIHRIRGEDPPETAVKLAENELCEVTAGKTSMPVLDLIFLGMGEDGHVASLFPGVAAKARDISVPFLVVNDSPKPPPTRISMSYEMIFAAKSVWILISGAGKESALRESISPRGQTPLAHVVQARPVKIFTDVANFNL